MRNWSGSPLARALAPLTIAAFALLARAAAAGLVDVTGTVEAGDGTPIAGATVSLTASSGATSVVTDAQGHFTLHVSEGTYSVAASAPGYSPLSQRTVTVLESQHDFALVLGSETVNALTVIGTVRATAGETVSTASAPSLTLSAQDAAASGSTTVASMLFNQLSTTPFLALGGGSNATVTLAVRGPDPTETLVDVDGHQVNNGNTGDYDLSLVDPASLQSVQLLYGIAPSSLLGPNTIGGAVNVLTLQPTQTPHVLVRAFGGSYDSFGETAQATGTDGAFGYALSLHGTTSMGSINQTVLAPTPGTGPSRHHLYEQLVGSHSGSSSQLAKLRYQIGGPSGFGYVQVSYRGQSVIKDDSALLTNYTPPGFSGGGEDDDLRTGALRPFDRPPPGGYQSFSGTTLGAVQANYGVDAQLPLTARLIDGAPATLLQFSHLSSINSQSVNGPGAQAQPYLYNQRDSLADDWLQIVQRFPSGTLTLKADLGTESLGTDFIANQVTAEGVSIPPVRSAQPLFVPHDDDEAPLLYENVAQTQRSIVLRYEGDPSSHIHYALAAYYSNYSTFGTSFDPRVGFVWTPTGSTAVRASVGTTFQTPQLSELIVPPVGDRVPVGGITYVGNPNLKPDFATDFDLGGDQLFGSSAQPWRLSVDLYQTNLRSPANQLFPACGSDDDAADAKKPCLSYPVNAGNGIYRGIDVSLDHQFGRTFRVRAGWDVDSSFLTVVPANIQDGTLVVGEQSLGQPLHKAYFDVEHDADRGFVYGAELNYHGWYNELNLAPFATLDAHVAYRTGGFEFGLYGTNLTSAYGQPFTVTGGGVPYGTLPGQPLIFPPAYTLQGAKVVFVATRAL